MKQKKAVLIFLQVLISIPLFITFMGVIWQVFSRYVLSVPSKNSEELIRFALVFLTFLSGAYCFVARRHIALDLIEMKSSRLSLVLRLVQLAVALAFTIFILLYGGLYKALSQYQQLSSSFNISMFYIYLIIPISGIIIATWAISQVWRIFQEKVKHL